MKIIDKFTSKINILVSMVHLYRFLLIVISVLIAVALCWFGLRTYGSGRIKSSYQTPLIEALSQKKMTLWKADFSQPQPGGFYFSSLYYSKQWLVGDAQKNIPLQEFLHEASQSYFLFSVDISQTQQLAQLKQIVDDGEHWKRTIFTSSKDGIVSEMRKLSPQWSFANGEIFLTRYLSLATLGLESLMNISSDVVLIRPSVVEQHPEVSTLIDNAKKQKKYILIGPTSRPSEEFSVNGWLIQR